jgi:hypothetical protein
MLPANSLPTAEKTLRGHEKFAGSGISASPKTPFGQWLAANSAVPKKNFPCRRETAKGRPLPGGPFRGWPGSEPGVPAFPFPQA